MEITGHHPESRRDDATGVTTLGENIDRGGRAHADDDGGRARDELGADTIREPVLADFSRGRVIETQSLHGVMTEMMARSAAAQQRGLQDGGSGRDDAGEGDARGSMCGKQSRQRDGVERGSRDFAVGEDLATIDDAPVSVRVADIETEESHGKKVSGGRAGASVRVYAG